MSSILSSTTSTIAATSSSKRKKVLNSAQYAENINNNNSNSLSCDEHYKKKKYYPRRSVINAVNIMKSQKGLANSSQNSSNKEIEKYIESNSDKDKKIYNMHCCICDC